MILNYSGIFTGIVGLVTVIAGVYFAKEQSDRMLPLSEISINSPKTKWVIFLGMGTTGLLTPIVVFLYNQKVHSDNINGYFYLAVITGFFSILVPTLLFLNKFRTHVYIAGLYVIFTYFYQLLIVLELNKMNSTVSFLLFMILALNIISMLTLAILYFHKIYFEYSFAIFTGLFIIVLNLIYLG